MGWGEEKAPALPANRASRGSLNAASQSLRAGPAPLNDSAWRWTRMMDLTRCGLRVRQSTIGTELRSFPNQLQAGVKPFGPTALPADAASRWR